QAGVVGPAVRRLGEPRALRTGLACGALAFVVYGLAPTGGIFLMGIPLGALYGLTYPSLQGLMTRRVGPDEQGRLQGALGCLMGIAGDGELAGEPLHFERTPHGFRALAAVPFDGADSVAARATVERAGGATDTVVVWLVPRRRRAPRERLHAAPALVQPPDSLAGQLQEERELVEGVRRRAHDTPRLW